MIALANTPVYRYAAQAQVRRAKGDANAVESIMQGRVQTVPSEQLVQNVRYCF